MAKITLTEALAQHKLTLKKIDDKTRELSNYTVRDSRIVDPLLKGGTTSDKFVAEQMQSISDLGVHAVKLRAVISQKNKEVRVRFGTFDMTVEDALAWRREVAPRMQTLRSGLLNQARAARAKASSSVDTTNAGVVVNFDETLVMKDLETVQDALGKLDTELSIVNATQTVEV